MFGGVEKPQRGEGAEDGAESVHETLEAEGAAVRARRDVRSEQRFFRGRANAAAKPGGGAGGQDLQCVRGETK